jgi:peptide/nickel transport system substrate-binding protein
LTAPANLFELFQAPSEKRRVEEASMAQHKAWHLGLGAICRWLAASLLAAGTGVAQPRAPGTVTYANAAGPGTLDPHLAGNTVEIEVVNQIFEGLVSLDEHYHPKPMLASKVEANPDATTYTFTLRHGVKFQNGKEFTSADAAASLQRYARVSPNTALLADVEGYDTPDPYVLVVRFKKPAPLFQDMLVTPIYPVLMIPAEQAGKAAREAEIIGTGPFRL